MKKTYLLFLAIVAAAIIPLLLANKGKPGGSLDDFASCLSQKGVTMYGAEWCSHCQNEKKAFGDSFRLVPYVECPQNPKLCLEAGISGFPTWTFPGGKAIIGEQGLEKLSQESGCPLP